MERRAGWPCVFDELRKPVCCSEVLAHLRNRIGLNHGET